MASMSARVSRGLGEVTRRHPRSSGYQSVNVNPKLWKIGRQPSMTAEPGSTDVDEICSKFASRLRCDRTTPFGLPPLPLVKRSAASSRSPLAGMPMRPATHWFGSSHAAAIHGIIARLPPDASISARRSSERSGQGKSGSRGRMASAVSTVRMPASSMLARAAALPAVKLRLTGTFPAHATARLAIAAPAPGGRTMPTRRSATVRLMRPESTAAAPTSWAALTTRRPDVRSTMAVDPGRRARARTVSRATCRRRTGLSSKASVPSSMIALRAETASARACGIGAPKATHTGVRLRRGDFQRYRLPAKENTDPQRPSTAAGTTGTLALRAMSSKPLRMAISWPVREIPPSGNTHTSSPHSRALTASLSHCEGLSGETVITPARLKIQSSRPPVPGPR